jgi:CheY-like chemotaxis protein
MLTSGGRPGDVARCRELGIEAYLTKPVRQTELLQVIINVLALKPYKPQLPRSDSDVGRARTGGGLRILVAEDNLVNQQVALRILENEGHSIRLAGDGREVLGALELESFDLVLMDVQMPEMDAFETTGAIRARERFTGQHLPIVAMTAYAMSGDREKCLAAGMDAYVAKPIRKPALLDAIKNATARPQETAVEGGL